MSIHTKNNEKNTCNIECHTKLLEFTPNVVFLFHTKINEFYHKKYLIALPFNFEFNTIFNEIHTIYF